MAEFRVLVCGGRKFAHRVWLYSVLNRHHYRHPITQIIDNGEVVGANTMACEWAKDNRVPVLQFNPDLRLVGRLGTPLRAHNILHNTKPDLVIAFPGGERTLTMATMAQAANLIIEEQVEPYAHLIEPALMEIRPENLSAA